MAIVFNKLYNFHTSTNFKSVIWAGIENQNVFP